MTIEEFVLTHYDCIPGANDSEYRIICPNCGHYRRKCYIYFAITAYKCYHCEDSGTLKSFMYRYHKDEYRDVEITSNAFNLANRVSNLKPVGLPEGYCPINIKNLQPWESEAINYLLSRGFDYKQIEGKFALCSEYPNHLIVPLRDATGTLSYWTGLKYKEDHRKTIFPKKTKGKVSKKGILYNILGARHSNNVVLCEGVFDALSFNHIKINAVALLGKSISVEQLLLLRSANFHSITIALDGDAADAATKVAYLVSTICKQVYIIRFPKTLDPNDAMRLGQLQSFYQGREVMGSISKIKRINRLP